MHCLFCVGSVVRELEIVSRLHLRQHPVDRVKQALTTVSCVLWKNGAEVGNPLRVGTSGSHCKPPYVLYKLVTCRVICGTTIAVLQRV